MTMHSENYLKADELRQIWKEEFLPSIRQEIKLELPVLSISFEVDVPTEKVDGSLLFEHQRRELPRGVWGHAPRKIFKIRCLEMQYSRQYLGLKNNQN